MVKMEGVKDLHLNKLKPHWKSIKLLQKERLILKALLSNLDYQSIELLYRWFLSHLQPVEDKL